MNQILKDSILRLHLPEWRDSQAVTRQVVTAFSRECFRIHLTGARGDRLLLAGLAGDWPAEIRIDGQVGTELARDLNCPNLTILATDDVGAGAGAGMKAGRILIQGRAGALTGTRIENGEIWCLGPAGNRLAHRARGGVIVVGNALGTMCMDRRTGGTVRIQRYPNDSADAKQVQATIESIMSWPEEKP